MLAITNIPKNYIHVIVLVSIDLISVLGYLMDSKTRKIITEEGFKDKYPFRFSDIFV
jgi:hypothetical protein